MDCHSPGQGLMPVSFKVHIVPLDGDEFVTEEVPDPDFGEAAIGRVAPIDSDGSCMIDRRMGIHGHPLEIQALFYSALLCAREMLAPKDGSVDLIRALNNRLLTVSCIKMGRTEIAAKAVEIAEKRISRDNWPEYYDTKRSRFIGKQAQLFRTWSIAGYPVAKLLLADPGKAKLFITEEDSELVNAFSCMFSANPRRKRGRKNLKQTYIV
ncbi:hypothetical protein C1H46_031984 [Malus baccata]|uniref:Alkaline/neutral invertase n=1 Tax=Malus baccata TaxID=106549 RepID=A0A540L7L2_MALBA|nr:hypothetical protein C1H46_031984 [Malus baccata]